MKTRSLPQLELTAMLIGARLIKWVIDTLKVKLNSVHLWTDNEASLQWVRNNKSDLVYVRNRVAEIRRLKDKYKFSTFHVSSSDNPADLLSRGVKYVQLEESQLWWHGPQWLVHVDRWPVQKVHVAAPVVSLEITLDREVVEGSLDDFINYHKYSDWVNLINVTQYVLNFVKVKLMPNLKVNAQLYWLRFVQQEYFPIVRVILMGGLIKPSKHPSMKLIMDLG